MRRWLRTALARAEDLAGYGAHWCYNRKDEAFRRLASVASYVGIWDDHEAVNDAGSARRCVRASALRPRRLLDAARPARVPRLQPGAGVARHAGATAPCAGGGTSSSSYSIRAGTATAAPDAPERPKTLLGREQHRWLEQRVAHSDATWKVIVSSVPIAIPTGTARSGERRLGQPRHADGLRGGASRDLPGLAWSGAVNSLWLTTGVHHASAFRYAPLPEQPDFRSLGVVTSPLHAALASRAEQRRASPRCAGERRGTSDRSVLSS